MRQFIILALLIILVTACAPKVDVEQAKPVVTPTEEKEQPEEAVMEEPEELRGEEKNLIEIKPDSFYPKEKTIAKNSEVEWIKKDPRDYQIACYLKGERIALSPNLKEGDSFTYKFSEEGEYTCLTFPYGLRNIITVEAKPLLSPTGSVIGDGGIAGTSFGAIAIIAVLIILFFIFGRKKKIKILGY